MLPDLPAFSTVRREVDGPAVSGPTWHIVVGVTTRDRMKISTFRIDDEDVTAILYVGVESDPSPIRRPARRAGMLADGRQLHGMIALRVVQPDLGCART